MDKRIIIFTCLVLGLAANALGLKTSVIEFGRSGSYSYQAAISIGLTSNTLNLYSESFGSTVTLEQLATSAGVTDHGALNGLGDDDHSVYQNTARHTSAHSAAYNNALSVSGGIGSPSNIGEHIASNRYHFSKPSLVFEVDSDGTRSYATIAAAAADADTSGGGTILVWPNINGYNEQVSLGSGVNLVGVASKNAILTCKIYYSAAGGAVISTAGSNVIMGIGIENTATGGTRNSAIHFSGSLTVYDCLLTQGVGGWGLVYGAVANRPTFDGCQLLGGEKLFYTNRGANIYRAIINKTLDEEVFTGAASNSTWSVFWCSIENQFAGDNEGLFSLDGTPGTVRMVDCIFLNAVNGLPGRLFRHDTLAGTAQIHNIGNITTIGSGAITYTPYRTYRPAFEERVVIYDNTSSVTLLLQRESGGSGNYIEVRNTAGTLKAKLDSDGIWTPSLAGVEDEAVNIGFHGTTSTLTSLQDFFRKIVSSAEIGVTTYTSNGDGSAFVSGSFGILRDSNSLDGVFGFADWAASTTLSLVDGETNHVFATYNNNSPVLDVTITESDIDGNTMVELLEIARDGNTLHFGPHGPILRDWMKKLNQFLHDNFGALRGASGLRISEVGTRNLAVTAAPRAWKELRSFGVNAFNSATSDTFTYWVRSGATTWISLKSQTQLSALYYDDGDSTAVLSANRHANSWVYSHIAENDKHVVYGRGNFTEAEALLESAPSSLPYVLDNFGVLLGRFTYKKNVNNAVDVSSAFDVQFPASQVTNHDDLSNLNTTNYSHPTDADKDTLTDGSNADTLHTHTNFNGITLDTGSINLPQDESINDGTISLTFDSTPSFDFTGAPIYAPVGSVGAPTYSFASDPNTGIYSTSNNLRIAADGTLAAAFTKTVATFPGVARYGDGTAGAPSISYGNDTDSGWYRVTANTIAAATSGVERVRISDGTSWTLTVSGYAVATMFVDATPGWSGTPMEAWAAAAAIRSDDDGNLDHKTLPAPVKTIIKKVELIETEVETDIERGGKYFVEVETEKDGRNVSMNVTMNSVALGAAKTDSVAQQAQIDDLLARIELIEDRLEIAHAEMTRGLIGATGLFLILVSIGAAIARSSRDGKRRVA